MQTITDELKFFFATTGFKQADLAKASGVPAPTICNLLKGHRKNLWGKNQDAIRKAIKELTAAEKVTLSADSPEVRSWVSGMRKT